MGDRLRIISSFLGRTIPVQVSHAAAGFPGSAVDSGDRHRFWRGTVLTTTTLMWDAGSGQTVTPDTLVIPRADLLAVVQARIAVEWSADAVAGWTTVGAPFPLEPITLAHLLAPGGKDYVAEWTGIAKRAWRIRLYGNTDMLAVPQIAGGGGFGTRVEVPADPRYDDRRLEPNRAIRGEAVSLTWGPLSDSAARTLRDVFAAITPTWPAQVPVATGAGAVSGGLQHYLYDPTGRIFGYSQAATPYLIPVVCVTPEAAWTSAIAPNLEAGQTGMTWARVT